MIGTDLWFAFALVFFLLILERSKNSHVFYCSIRKKWGKSLCFAKCRGSSQMNSQRKEPIVNKNTYEIRTSSFKLMYEHLIINHSGFPAKVK